MKFSDVKLLLPSSGYMKTSEAGGRTVIDEIRDASYERNHQSFVGDDRPELHQGLDGNFFTSVEKESTNLFLNSDTLSTQGVEVTANPYTVSFEGAGTITFSGAHSGTLEGVEGKRVETTFTPSAGTLTCTVSGEVLKAQIEQSAYATLYIPTQGTPVTRLAPEPVIQNALPETGTVAGVVDMVSINGIITGVWDTLGGTFTRKSRFFWQEQSPRFFLQIFGTDGGGGISFAYPSRGNNVRFKFAYFITYNNSDIRLKILDSNEIRGTTQSHTINDTSIREFFLGFDFTNPKHSSRHENFYKDEIVRVNATDAEIKAFFETLVKGTSMEMKASEMTII